MVQSKQKISINENKRPENLHQALSGRLNFNQIRSPFREFSR